MIRVFDAENRQLVTRDSYDLAGHHVSIGASNLHSDNTNVIREGPALGIFTDIAHHSVEEFLRRQGSVTTDSRSELLFTEERAGRILYLVRAVSEKHNEVALHH